MTEFFEDGGLVYWRAVSVDGSIVAVSPHGSPNLRIATEEASRAHKALADWLGVPSEVTDPKTTPINITD